MNQAIEIHDSTLKSLTQVGRGLEIHLSPAYIHQSEGRPGHDEGIGWYQDAIFRIPNGTIIIPSKMMPVDLIDGCVKIGSGMNSANVIPLPLMTQGKVEISFQDTTGSFIQVNGVGLVVELVGKPGAIEKFRGLS
jgi:hypothetical protein